MPEQATKKSLLREMEKTCDPFFESDENTTRQRGRYD